MPRIETGPERPGDIRHSIGDPSRLNRVLEVTARTPLGEGLKTVTGWLAGEFAAPETEGQT